MSNWLALFIGLIVGGFIGLVLGRKNYESCREMLKKMHAEFQAREAELGALASEIEELHHELEEVQSPEEAPTRSLDTPSTEAQGTEDSAPSMEGDQTTAEMTASVDETSSPTDESSTQGERATAEDIGPGEAIPSRPTVADASQETQASSPAAPEPQETATMAAAVAASQAQGAPPTVSECPQKLARIRGIGRVYEDKLYQAGIGSYWQVAITPEDQLADIFGIKDFQAVDLAAIRAHARQLAEETGTVGRLWNGHQPDDLESLPGIGKTYEMRLYEAGICTWEKLAALTEEELAAIIKAPKMRQPDYAAWIAMARERIAQG